jgi:3-oxoacyl-[acyl-carrier protein] reductase
MTISWNFSGRTVLVTGAAQGIGAALVSFFRDAGARVVAMDLDLEPRQHVHGCGPDIVHVAADVGNPDVVAEAFDKHEALASIDILINNAGIARDAMVWKLTDEQWQSVLNVHLTGTFTLTRAVAPHMREHSFGRIINVTSYTGLHGNLGQANYAAAKAGIIGFTKSAAKDLARFGITVNAISPNAATPMVRAVPEPQFRQLEAAIPLGRFAEPAEICPAVGFLASDEAGYTTGIVLPVDGGMAM